MGNFDDNVGGRGDVMLRGKNTSPFNIKSHFDDSLGDESLNMSWYRPKYTNQR